MTDSIYVMDNEEREDLLWFQNIIYNIIYMKRQLNTVIQIQHYTQKQENGHISKNRLFSKQHIRDSNQKKYA